MRHIPGIGRHLRQRIARLEEREAHLRATVTTELEQTAIALEDVVVALDALRERVEALEGAQAPMSR